MAGRNVWVEGGVRMGLCVYCARRAGVRGDGMRESCMCGLVLTGDGMMVVGRGIVFFFCEAQLRRKGLELESDKDAGITRGDVPSR